MKVILSRKGFDSSYGGFPSIILPDGKMISFPIPESDPNCDGKYAKDLKYKINNKKELSLSLEDYLEKLDIKKKIKIPDFKDATNRKGLDWDYNGINYRTKFHYDPKIQQIDIPDNKGPAQFATFGQSGAAAGHLVNNKISPDGLKGDPALFLFFGLFQKTEWEDENHTKLKTIGKPFHAIWGYLIATGAINISSYIENNEKNFNQCKCFEEDDKEDIVNEIKKHPHFINRYFYKHTPQKNKDYFLKNIIFWGKRFGTFNFDEKTEKYLRLSDIDNSNNLTDWLIPKFITKMTYNSTSIKKSRKNNNFIDDKLKIRAASKGQEFVITKADKAEMKKWLEKIGIAEDYLYHIEMTLLRKADTKLPVNIWIDETDIATHPKVLFQNNNTDKFTAEKDLIPISVEERPKVLMQDYSLEISAGDFEKITNFISSNRTAILRYIQDTSFGITDLFKNIT